MMLLEERRESQKEVLPWSTWATMVTFCLGQQGDLRRVGGVGRGAYSDVG